MPSEKDKDKEPKRKIGRPLKWGKAEEMIEAINKYFQETPEGEYTITGLGLAIGLDRKGIISYGERDEFAYAVKTAKQIIEEDYEKSLRKNGRAGDIFGLKNFGWTDKYDIESTIPTQSHQPLSKTMGLVEKWSNGIREDGDNPESLPN